MADTTTLSDTALALRLARALGWHDVAYGERAPDQCHAPALDVVIVNGRGYMLTWLLTGDGMLAVLGELEKRSIPITVELHDSCCRWVQTTVRKRLALPTVHDLPRAVAEAALSALEAGQ